MQNTVQRRKQRIRNSCRLPDRDLYLRVRHRQTSSVHVSLIIDRTEKETTYTPTSHRVTKCSIWNLSSPPPSLSFLCRLQWVSYILRMSVQLPFTSRTLSWHPDFVPTLLDYTCRTQPTPQKRPLLVISVARTPLNLLGPKAVGACNNSKQNAAKIGLEKRNATPTVTLWQSVSVRSRIAPKIPSLRTGCPSNLQSAQFIIAPATRRRKASEQSGVFLISIKFRHDPKEGTSRQDGHKWRTLMMD